VKLFNRIGDALLEKLVPGIHATANCGTCSRRVKAGCCDWWLRRFYWYDNCDTMCYTTCRTDCNCGGFC
jgi:hypothetical protein